ncbi:hypothetical protein BD289DRAFT_371743 [Coniella lustricola]|uniref:Uncharacterized protein n=1 Tax=Coniella lustricola TaxID=2025994 RepID=A0A2T3A3A3_9PEZI|nr:hypothetical protein BD289DRAFT_371743 [Coniella lustricola]
MQSQDVTFIPPYTYSRQPTIKAACIQAILKAAPAKAHRATVVNGWHTSKSDKRSHCTADYYDSENVHLGRKHVV